MKHNKKRNTAFLYEVLIRVLTRVSLHEDREEKDKVIGALKNFFSKRSVLREELNLYKEVLNTSALKAKQAEKLDNEEDIEKAEEEQSIPRLLPPPKIAPDGKHSTNDPNWEEDFTTYPRVKNIQSVLLLDDLKGYVVVEADGASSMFNAVQGIRHVRGQLRGELGYNEIEKYLVKKSVVSELAVDNTVEIIGGPFKGMKATVTRVDKEKEEATVVLLDAAYELPVTVDANYLKLIPT